MIKLTENLALDADERQYIVGNPRQRAARDGTRDFLESPCYLPTLEKALVRAADRAVREGVASGEITSIVDCVTEYRRHLNEFKTAVGAWRESAGM